MVAPLSGAPLEIPLRVHGVAPAESLAGHVLVRRIDQAVPGEPSTNALVPTANGLVARLELDRSHHWEIRSSVPGYWSGWKTIAPAQEPPPLDLWPSARVSGTLAVPRGEPLPQRLVLEFEPAEQVPAADAPPHAHDECAIGEGARFACEVPSGRLDLALRAKRFVPRYFWNQTVRARQELKLGAVAIRRGASLLGRVIVEARAPGGRGTVTVTLEPASVPGDRDSASRLTRGKRLQTGVSPRGYFQFDNAEPGTYTVVAEKEGLAPTRREVRLVEEAEAQLREPLRLAAVKQLRIRLVPATDPYGRRWNVEMSEAFDQSSIRVTGGPVSADGEWRAGVPLGVGRTYLVAISTSAGEIWRQEALDTDALGDEVVYELPAIRVEGRILIGSKPLRSNLQFGGERGSESIPVSSDVDGAFRLFLPRAGAWSVTVVSHEPEVHRQVKADVIPDPVSDAARAVIRLGASVLSGDIVDTAGRRPVRAAVDVVRKATGERLQHAAEGGSFRLEGLEEGKVSVRAFDEASESSAVDVVLKDEGETDPLHLVLYPRGRVRGRVLSRFGTGVAGAVVQLLPQVPPFAYPLKRTTDADGFFELSLPNGTARFSVGVLATGFGVRTLTLTPPEDRTEVLPIYVSEEHGRLVASFSTDAAAGAERRFAFLVHEGCLFPVRLPMILGDAGETKNDAITEITLPSMEPGVYSLCVASIDQIAQSGSLANSCMAGTLATGGELKLKAR